jgi:HAD superfamily hydrolase (TIGR01549 family)
MNTKLIVFDLDGTLVDSSQTIYDATIKTFDALKIDHKLSKDDLDRRIGAHFQDIFEELNIIVEDFEYFIDIYKKIYFEVMHTSTLYPYVRDTIKNLHAQNISLALLTTKGQEQADRIIDYFDLRPYFSYVMGRRLEMKVKPDPEPLLYICNELSIPKEKSMMVGDTEFDIRCAKAAGIKSCAVEYGYRSRDFIESEHPDFMIETFDKLLDLIEL